MRSADQDPPALVAVGHRLGRQATDALQRHGGEGEVAAPALGAHQAGHGDALELGPQPLVGGQLLPSSWPPTSGCGPSSRASPWPAWWAPSAGAATSPSPPWRWRASVACRPRRWPTATSAGGSWSADRMFLWFLGVSFAAVWNVFRSPVLDYRLVMVGAVLPLAEIPFGGPKLLHTLAFSVGLLAAVMLA